MKTLCVIPARYASTRFPGKPLADIAGRPMIEHVYLRAKSVENIDEVIVATDDKRIEETVSGFGGTAVMTDPSLPSGTDRVYQAIKDKTADVIINLQGDEPFVRPELLQDLVKVFSDENIQIATPVCGIKDKSEYTNSHIVKVVRDVNGFALYFSRSQIPFFRNSDTHAFNEQKTCYKHIGIYAYRKNILTRLTQLAESSLEKSEKLEQLRFLENGYKIFTILTDYNSVSVDTPEDLEKIRLMVRNNEL